MRWNQLGLIAAGVALAMAPIPKAEALEAHIGAMAHNVCIADCKNAGVEEGPSIELQLSFDSPAFLRRIGSPQPYMIASANTAGNTNFAAVGLEWRIDVADGWAVEPGLGYAVHDGELENPHPPGSPQSLAFSDEHLLFGSRDSFRVSLALTRDLPGPWQAQLLYSHLSHGQILGNGRNQALDQVGVRLGYRFGA